MTKKNLFVKILIMLVFVAVMLPSFVQRVKNEERNKDVMFALNYNSARMLLSDEELDRSLAENKKNGVNNVIIAEESINSLISAGYVTGIKYNVLCHKYDDESEDIIKLIKDNKKIHNDSYLLITKRPDCKEYLEKWMGAKYTQEEYIKVTTTTDADVYLIYREIGNAAQATVGFDESKIEFAYEKGFNVVLSLMVHPFAKTDYVDYIAELVDKYDVKFINLKKSFSKQDNKKAENKTIDAFCKLIKEKNLYLILTEDQTQLSNQKPIGYEKLIESAAGKVLRGYDTIDFYTTNTGDTTGEKRYQQILNSVVDRNIRFVTINQLSNGTSSLDKKSAVTNLSTKAAMDRISRIGFNTQEYDTKYSGYIVNRRLSSAAAIILMILMGLMILEWLCGKKLLKLELLAAAGALLATVFTFVAPISIVELYPTAFAAIAPSFMITAIMAYAKNTCNKLPTIKFFLSALLLTAVMFVLCGVVQSALLSGLDYHLNSLIFRGIKLSLFAPIVFSIVAFAILFMEKTEKLSKRIIRILNAQIKVYWVIIAVVMSAVVAIYLIRSGNVTSISGFETYMRNAITELMTARPRTKEFLVGWPCLVLFLYYIKNSGCRFIQWGFAVGSSILFASVINSFCHVFTSASIIYMRVLNGMIVGAVISAVFLIINEIIVRLIKKYVIAGKE